MGVCPLLFVPESGGRRGSPCSVGNSISSSPLTVLRGGKAQAGVRVPGMGVCRRSCRAKGPRGFWSRTQPPRLAAPTE